MICASSFSKMKSQGTHFKGILARKNSLHTSTMTTRFHYEVLSHRALFAGTSHIEPCWQTASPHPHRTVFIGSIHLSRTSKYIRQSADLFQKSVTPTYRAVSPYLFCSYTTSNLLTLTLFYTQREACAVQLNFSRQFNFWII